MTITAHSRTPLPLTPITHARDLHVSPLTTITPPITPFTHPPPSRSPTPLREWGTGGTTPTGPNPTPLARRNPHAVTPTTCPLDTAAVLIVLLLAGALIRRVLLPRSTP